MAATVNPSELFDELGGRLYNGFPAIHAVVYRTANGTPYLKKPGVVMIARPQVELSGMQEFLDGFDPELGFGDYLSDPDQLPAPSQLSKVSGQICYASFGPGRSWNRDGAKYLDNIKAQKHGSVIEHASVSFFLYGISRSLTHEGVRHRAGTAFSQISQRYVDGKVLRFVLRPEYDDGGELLQDAENDFDDRADKYEQTAQKLLTRQKGGSELLSGEKARDRRKKVNQAARSYLPNHTEAPMVWTGNMRSWRHVGEMRASEHAEVEINELAVRIYLCLYQLDPIMFSDYKLDRLEDGRYAISTEYVKV